MSEYLLEKFNEVEKAHWWWEGRREFIKAWLKKDAKSRILEVGCGTGETLSFIREILPQSKLYGVDNSKTAIKYTRYRGHKNVKYSSATKLPFRNKIFDNVLFLDVLEHIENDGLAILEAKRVLKDGGRIIITAPALKFIWSDHDVHQGHKRRYDGQEIRKLAKVAGLNILKITHFNVLLSMPIVFVRLASRLGFFKFLSSYDNGLNYDIAAKRLLNSMLKVIFVNEVKILNHISFPFGVSIGAVLKRR